MYKRLIDFVEENDILSKHQYWFRKNRSTEHAIIELIDKVTRAIDEGKYTQLVFFLICQKFLTLSITGFWLGNSNIMGSEALQNVGLKVI
jgi:hypothetical protein